ncbi:MAG: putative NUDIX family NTP pyrophosphohydrolase [Ilumatobacter sp.]|jgi:predicted NUDIX family NTP pyrophosphohydrolase
MNAPATSMDALDDRLITAPLYSPAGWPTVAGRYVAAMAARPPVRSSGILLYRSMHVTDGDDVLEILIGHMGGPFWAAKEQAAWTIPKGLVDVGDIDDLTAARREFREETGQEVPTSDLIDLGVFAQSRTKEIHIWAGRGDLDPALCASNTFEMEWPPKSGQTQHFAELDRFDWCSLAVAEDRLVAGQRPVLDALKTVACTDTA